MKNFGYCIWLTSSKKNNIWNEYTNGFQSHITIKYNMTLKQASFFINTLEKKINNKKYKIKLSDELFYSQEENFYCLYKKAYLCEEEKIPDWFPLNAHVSFYYSYYPISKEIYENVKKKVENKNIEIFDYIEIKLCDDHFLLW